MPLLNRGQRRLLARKLQKKERIESVRDRLRYADVSAIGHLWQADENSQLLLLKAIVTGQAGLGLPPVWRSANNVDVEITSINQLLAIAGAMAVQTQVSYTWSWTKKAALLAAANETELSQVNEEE